MIRLYYFITICVITFLLSMVSCSVYSNYKITELVKAGVDPVEARYALSTLPAANELLVVVSRNKELKR